MKKSTPNPYYELSDWKSQKDFLRRAAAHYADKGGSSYSVWDYQNSKPKVPRTKMDVVQYLYDIGRAYRILKCSFQQFHHYLAFGTPIIKEEPRKGWYTSHGRLFFWKRVNTPWRIPQSYRHKPEHVKKNSNPTPQQEWRERKRFGQKKTRRKHQNQQKQQSWQKHRIKERNYLHRQEWDDNYVLNVKFYADPDRWY